MSHTTNTYAKLNIRNPDNVEVENSSQSNIRNPEKKLESLNSPKEFNAEERVRSAQTPISYQTDAHLMDLEKC